jgi:hypothetical protein
MLKVLKDVALGLPACSAPKEDEDNAHATRTAPRGAEDRVVETPRRRCAAGSRGSRLSENPRTRTPRRAEDGEREGRAGSRGLERARLPRSTEPDSTRKIVVMSSAPRAMPKSEVEPPPAVQAEPEVSERPPVQEAHRQPHAKNGARQPATLLIRGSTGEPASTEASRPPEAPPRRSGEAASRSRAGWRRAGPPPVDPVLKNQPPQGPEPPRALLEKRSQSLHPGR